MRMKLLLMVAVVSGCVPETNYVRRAITIHPVATSAWTPEMLADQLQACNDAYGPAGVTFEMSEVTQNTGFIEVNTDIDIWYAEMFQTFSPEITVIYANRGAYCAFAHMPPMNLIVVTPCGGEWATAHEIGHQRYGFVDEDRQDGHLMGRANPREYDPWLDVEQIEIVRAKERQEISR